MRILMLNHNVAWSGGTFFRAYHLARYLVRRNHDVVLLSISKTRRNGFSEITSDGVKIIETPDLLWGYGRTGWDPWDTWQRIQYTRELSFDLVHAFDSRPVVILPALNVQRRGTALVLDWADWWGRGGTQSDRMNQWLNLIAPIETFFEENFRAQADGNTVISQALSERAVKLGVPLSAIHVLPQGCDVETWQVKDRVESRTSLGIPIKTSLVGFLGTLNRSDADLLLSTFRLLFRQRRNLKGVMIGNHHLRIPRDLCDTGQLIETGFVSERDLRDWVAACDVFLAPLGDTTASRARWPSKVNVFLAAGRVTVTTRVGDLAKILEEQRAGLVTQCNPEDIARMVCTLLDDNSMRLEYEARARELAESELSWHNIVSGLDSFYNQVLNTTG